MRSHAGMNTRGRWAVWLCGLCLLAVGGSAGAAQTALPAEFLIAADPAQAVVSGALDARFRPLPARWAGAPAEPIWLRILPPLSSSPELGAPTLLVRVARGVAVHLYAAGTGPLRPIARIAALPDFRDLQDELFLLPSADAPTGALYARIDGHGRPVGDLRVARAPLPRLWTQAAQRERMIALAFGALAAMSIAALTIWFVLLDRVFVDYAAFFSLEALYVAYLSGQGFGWPMLSWAAPLGSHAWNVPVALSGAMGCLFVREIADLRHYSPRVHAAFGTLAAGFVLLAAANALKPLGLGALVTGVGNLMFLAAAIFTLVVATLAWRRGIRAAGWFLVAWGLLEAFTIATAVEFLRGDEDGAQRLLYLDLPLSMVAAAVLAALGVADRLRHQRAALTEAERRAETDPLTGVLNRRSLIERLEAASLRARARGRPIALLFIDLDHFKAINDTHGHPAGDACLRAIVPPIQAELRQSDAIGRYGGEEFVVILGGADTAAAEAIAERIRARVAALGIEGFGATIRLTCSIGVAGSDTLGLWGDQLMARADAAVYVAKHTGRNRVQLALPLPV